MDFIQNYKFSPYLKISQGSKLNLVLSKEIHNFAAHLTGLVKILTETIRRQ